MKKLALTLCSLALLPISDAPAAQFVWDNIGTDYNTAANWTPDTVPTGANVAVFDTPAVMQPNLSASVSISGLYFRDADTTGYNITTANGSTFTLTGVSTTGSGGTANASAAAIRGENTSGANTVNPNLILGAAAGGNQSFFQAAGGTLIVNGAVSSTNSVTLRLTGGGTIELNGANSYSGGSSLNTAGTTVVVGNDTALGTGTFTVVNSGTITAGGGARTIGNAVVLDANTTVGGSNAFTFNGSLTGSGALTRTLTVNNTATTTFNGSVFLSEAAATGRTLVINGTGNVLINGQISNFNGAGTAGTLSKGGSGTLTLANTNTYSGGTLISGGTVVATQNGALGTGNVSLTAANVTLTLQGAFSNYISDTATLSIGFLDDTVNLNFTGSDTISMLTVNNMTMSPGVYGAVGSGAQFELAQLMGTGTLTVLVPEPATYMLMGLGVLICAQQFRRKRS